MNLLLDTNVISEWTKARPDAGAVRWLAEADEDRIFISVVTIAEIRHGIERLPRGHKRDRLDSWLTTDLPMRFEGRILPIDLQVGDCSAGSWPEVKAREGRSAAWTASSPRQPSGTVLPL